MKITHTMANDTIAQRPKRRYYSPELKGQIVAELTLYILHEPLQDSGRRIARHGCDTVCKLNGI